MGKDIRGLAQPYLKSLAAQNVGADRAYQILRDQFGAGYTRSAVRADIQSFRSAEQKASFARFSPANTQIPLSRHELFTGRSMKYPYQYVVSVVRTDSQGNELKPGYLQLGYTERPTRRQVLNDARDATERNVGKYEDVVTGSANIQLNYIRQDAYDLYASQ